MSSVLIRKMTLADLPQVLPLSFQLGYEAKLPELTKHFNNLIQDPTEELYVGVIADRIVAFAHIQETYQLLSGKRAELQALVVDESCRGRGVGKQMVLEAEKWSLSRGLSKIRLGSRNTRTDAHEFYKKIGFHIEKTWFVFVKSLKVSK